MTTVNGGNITSFMDNVLTFGGPPTNRNFGGGPPSNNTWDYTAFPPDAVFLLIGPNDASSSPVFDKAYRALLEKQVENYAYMISKDEGSTSPPKLISVCGGSINGLDPCEKIKRITKEFNKDRAVDDRATSSQGTASSDADSDDGFRAFYVSISEKHWHKINAWYGHSVFNGCDMHYNARGHAVLVEDILEKVEEILGLSTGGGEHREQAEVASADELISEVHS